MVEQVRKRKYFIGANWKCYSTVPQIKEIVEHMINDLDYDQNQMDFMILPGMLHLPLVQALVRKGILVGAQNCSATEEGAYTGEVAADAIKDYEIDYVMIGQNERRTQFGEDQEIVNAKVGQAEDCDLNVVYCCGETQQQRQDEETEQVIHSQLMVLKDGVQNWSSSIIVYEPLWAIGTGVIASADQTQDAAADIRKWVRENVGEAAAEEVRIVYGGPVTETNSENLIRLPDVDGFMVGGTSTKPIFRTIFEIVNNQVTSHKWA